MYAVEMRNITKLFGNFKANDNINLKVKKGTIHALIGENGAGKSTLMSILFGIYNQTSGTIFINGNLVNMNSPLEANAHGIGMVHQHFQLVEDFTVLENIVLGSEETIGNVFLSYKKSINKINEIMEKYNFNIDLKKRISDCSVAEQQRVEILKMLYRDSDILIFDEPTAVLSISQIESFLDAVIDLKNSGKTIIIITHKLDELKKVADVGTVIRLGKHIADIDIKSITHAELSKLMVGSDLSEVVNHDQNTDNETIFRISNLNVNKIGYSNIIGLKDFNLEIKAGEIIGIAGVEGNGQSELLNSITGLKSIKSGKIELLVNVEDSIFEHIIAIKELLTKKNKLFDRNDFDSIKTVIKKLDFETVNITKFNHNLEENIRIVLDISKKIINELNSTDFQQNSIKFNTFSTEIDKLIIAWQEFKTLSLGNSSFPYFKNINKIRKASRKWRNKLNPFENYWIDLSKQSIAKKYLLGMSHIPEDRHLHGLLLDMNLRDNAISQVVGNAPFNKYGIISYKNAKIFSELIVDRFDVRSSEGINSMARSLSGGNQQKFIVGRELTKYSKFIIISQPTRGLDVGAINIIHEYILNAKKEGKAILLISYEIDEIMSLVDRVIVLNSGEVSGELKKSEITREKLGILMSRKVVSNE